MKYRIFAQELVQQTQSFIILPYIFSSAVLFPAIRSLCFLFYYTPVTYFYKLGYSFFLYMWLSAHGLHTSGFLLSTAGSEIVFSDKPQLSSLSLINLFLSDYTMHTIILYLNETPMPHISVQGKEKIFKYRKYAFFYKLAKFIQILFHPIFFSLLTLC